MKIILLKELTYSPLKANSNKKIILNKHISLFNNTVVLPKARYLIICFSNVFDTNVYISLLSTI